MKAIGSVEVSLKHNNSACRQYCEVQYDFNKNKIKEDWPAMPSTSGIGLKKMQFECWDEKRQKNQQIRKQSCTVIRKYNAFVPIVPKCFQGQTCSVTEA